MANPTLNERTRDELIARDIRNTRAMAGIQNQVDRRLRQLQRDLRRLIFEIDPAGTERRDARARRAKRTTDQANELISEAFTEVNAMSRTALRRMTRLEAESFQITINNQLEQILG